MQAQWKASGCHLSTFRPAEKAQRWLWTTCATCGILWRTHSKLYVEFLEFRYLMDLNWFGQWDKRNMQKKTNYFTHMLIYSYIVFEMSSFDTLLEHRRNPTSSFPCVSLLALQPVGLCVVQWLLHLLQWFKGFTPRLNPARTECASGWDEHQQPSPPWPLSSCITISIHPSAGCLERNVALDGSASGISQRWDDGTSKIAN